MPGWPLHPWAVGDHPVREEVLVMSDPAVLQPLRVLGNRVCQPDLVDHPDIEPDVHAHHAEVGEKHRVLRLLWRSAARATSRRAVAIIGTRSH